MSHSPETGTTTPRRRRHRRLVPGTALAAVTAGCYSPQGSLDAAVNVNVQGNQVQVTGWAWDQDSPAPVTVHVSVDGAVVAGTAANLPRPDVAGAVPAAGPNRGYQVTVTATPGSHTVCAIALDAAGDDAHTLLGCKGVQVGPVTSSPVGSFDSAPLTTAPAAGVRVTGWVRDPDSSAPVTITVQADGQTMATAATNLARPDVAAAVPGAGPNTGFDVSVMLPPGTHHVCVTAADVAGGNAASSLGCKDPNVVARGNAANYSFFYTYGSGTPVRYNPCSGPIKYAINPTGAYSGAVADVQYAVAQISQATGLAFQYQGTTTAIPNEAYGTTLVNGAYAPVLIGFVHRDQTDLFGPPGDTVLAKGGSGGVTIGGVPRYVTGLVAVDLDTSSTYLAQGTGPGSFGTMLMHEIGHVVGLGHFTDVQQIMNPYITNGIKDFGAGDRTGLTAVGSAMGCLPSTAPSSGTARSATDELPLPGPIETVPEVGQRD
jgi:hypothetical protein